MKRSWLVWATFCASLGVLLAALGWTSLTVRRLDRKAAWALANGEFEGDVRLALWRLDSTLAGFIAQENSRPFAMYQSPGPMPTADDATDEKAGAGKPNSPLFDNRPEHVLLYFQYDSAGRLTSPQAPGTEILAEIPASKVAAATSNGSIVVNGPPGADAGAESQLRELWHSVDWLDVLARVPEAATPQSRPAAAEPRGQWDTTPQFAQSGIPSQQQAGPPEQSSQEFQLRSQNYQQLVGNNSAIAEFPFGIAGDLRVGAMQPLWIGSRLILARRVAVDGQTYLQGCVLDWPALRESLLATIRDLFPEARLVAAPDEATDSQAQNLERMLATLPVMLWPGSTPAPASAALTPIDWSLIVAWVSVLLAAAAVGSLLAGVMTLSERRGAFVSAVTHELRTPLTTFRMYAEMLADDMVPSEETRRHYLNTLKVEADRLSHLVENVLAYARLERAGRRGPPQSIPIAELLARATPRLTDRAESAGMTLNAATAPAAEGAVALADPSAVEQILFNLVDNACKYGKGRDDATIGLDVDATRRQIVLRVRDTGPGITSSERKRLFRPFSKSAHDAAHSAPGVGLGLALSRRLARELGGDLRLEPANGQGASFVLRIPRDNRKFGICILCVSASLRLLKQD